jgi:small subunit ribosomal protein S2
MAIITVKQLIEAGVHFGTKSSRWHPKMKPFIFGKRNGIHIIDLKQTAQALIQAYYFSAKLSKANKSILLVGTKRQAKEVIRDAARSLGMPFVTERWLGGTLTNLETIRMSIRRLDDIEAEIARPDYHRESKKVQSRHTRERRRILRNLEGVRNMTKLPDAVFVVDPGREMTVVREARRLNIPVIGLLDTDCDPEQVNLPVPGNDDGIRSIQTVISVILEGWNKGKADQVTRSEDPAPAAEAPKAEEAAPAADAAS